MEEKFNSNMHHLVYILVVFPIGFLLIMAQKLVKNEVHLMNLKNMTFKTKYWNQHTKYNNWITWAWNSVYFVYLNILGQIEKFCQYWFDVWSGQIDMEPCSFERSTQASFLFIPKKISLSYSYQKNLFIHTFIEYIVYLSLALLSEL